MPGFMPGIHVFLSHSQGVDGRDKPGHDESCRQSLNPSLTKPGASAATLRRRSPLLIISARE